MILGYLFAMCILAAVNVALLSHANSNYNQRGPYAAIFFAAFFSCVGYLFLGLSTNIDEANIANKICYLGASFLPMFTFQAILLVCDIKAPDRLNGFLGVLSFVVLGLAATTGYSDIYYTSMKWVELYGVGNYEATFGPGHLLFNFMLVFYLVANVSLLTYSFIKKKNVSFKNLIALTLVEIASIVSFLVARIIGTDTLVMPAVYVFDQLALLYICFRVRYYDINQSAMNALEEGNTDGFISVFFDHTFLGCNKIAYKFFEPLKESRVDKPLVGDSEIIKFLKSWVDECQSGNVEPVKEFQFGVRHYKFSVKVLRVTQRRAVYLFKAEDDSDVHNYVQMLGSSNIRLKSKIKSSDNLINAIQEQMIVGMANMVESRDSNTGGHIKRTSKVVSILVDELRKDRQRKYEDPFYDALVSAAPMHDLGKIAINDEILRKPGKFTPEEFEEMKTHPEKGAAIVENLLSQIEVPAFVNIARNVACFHHERYDGRGYPRGLSGENIPFEARVMAVADVYDALVSKRCYKEKFSFEDAFDIIAKGMGSQFDPSLWKCFYNCREKLEEYYKSST